MSTKKKETELLTVEGNKMTTINRKLELLQDPDVLQMLFDILHRRRQKYSAADNSGQHYEYKEMVAELEKDYIRIEEESNKAIKTETFNQLYGE